MVSEDEVITALKENGYPNISIGKEPKYKKIDVIYLEGSENASLDINKTYLDYFQGEDGGANISIENCPSDYELSNILDTILILFGDEYKGLGSRAVKELRNDIVYDEINIMFMDSKPGYNETTKENRTQRHLTVVMFYNKYY